MNLFLSPIKANIDITNPFSNFKLYRLDSEIQIGNITIKNEDGIKAYLNDDLIESATVEYYTKIIHEGGFFIINYNKIESVLRALVRIDMDPVLVNGEYKHILIRDTIKSVYKYIYILYNTETKNITLFNKRGRECFNKSHILYKVIY